MEDSSTFTFKFSIHFYRGRSNVTDAVLTDVRAWHSRPLDRLYPVIYLDCLVVKIKGEKGIANKAIYLALGINMEGQKELLGMWISQNEGAKFWLNVLTEVKNRGMEDVLITCVDGLSGFPEAIEAIYPNATVQLCIVHKIRQSLAYVSSSYPSKSVSQSPKKPRSPVNS